MKERARAEASAVARRVLALNGWMKIGVTPLEPHPNDGPSARPRGFDLPEPRTAPVYRLEATVGEPVSLGVFVSVGGRQPGGVVYETYLVA